MGVSIARAWQKRELTRNFCAVCEPQEWRACKKIEHPKMLDSGVESR
jgi:hypothetical protein